MQLRNLSLLPLLNKLGLAFVIPQPMNLSAETARARRASAIKDLTAKPLVQPRKPQRINDPDLSSTPLLNQENAARWKWASKLEAIGRRASDHSKLLTETDNSQGLSTAESEHLRQLVLSSGAPRTMAVHISSWERFENWVVAQGLQLFPLAHEVILKYVMHLDQNECGPTVIPSFKIALNGLLQN